MAGADSLLILMGIVRIVLGTDLESRYFFDNLRGPAETARVIFVGVSDDVVLAGTFATERLGCAICRRNI